MVTDAPERVQPPGDPPDKPKTWKELVVGENQSRLQLPENVLSEKITMSFPEGEEGDPSFVIAEDLIEILASNWRYSLIIKVLDTTVPYAIMGRKLKELWKPSGQFKLIELPNGY